MNNPEPILVSHLFSPMLDSLIHILKNLNDEDWQKPTACSSWTVKDVAQHLLAVEIGKISRRRDQYTPEKPKPITTHKHLVEYINKINQAWVQASSFISPKLLVELLSFIGKQTNEYFSNLDPYAIGPGVSWVGSGPAPMWLDIAREYTERWHHQQHIRDAVDQPGLKTIQYFSPVLETFCRALPYTYQHIPAVEGTQVGLIISGKCGGEWTLRREGAEWVLYTGVEGEYATQVVLDPEDAWRLFTKGIEPAEVRERSEIYGNEALGREIFNMVSLIA